tara:strand:+ start:477 stop:1682 length:1206 start_codon:yes stop_codon:yes gene_type:complete
MSRVTGKNLEIECPECGEIIDINEQISHQLQEETANQKKQLEIRIKKELQASHSVEIENMKADLAERDKLLLGKKDAEEAKDVRIQEMQHRLDTQAEKVEVEKQKAALKAKTEAMVEYKEMAEELAEQKNAASEQKNVQLQMKINELLDRERQTKEMHAEALRKAEQGSVQTQGEGGEIFIEDVLHQAFSQDVISEVPKGTKGADVLHTVRFGSEIEAGMIVWEGKRTKAWSNAWISKIKGDTVRVNGHISVIVSDVLPSKISRMTMIEENVWVCRYVELVALATALRTGLIRAQSAIKSQEGKGDKMALLYDYMSSQEFANEIRLVYDSFVAEKEIIAKERRTMESHWKARDKAADARLMGVTGLMGTIKSIATELPAIKEIEAADLKALPAPDDEESED